jgi:type IV secretory pathway VirB10-like protein
VIKFGGESTSGKTRAAQWVVFVGVGVFGLAAIGIFAWKAFAASKPMAPVQDDDAGVRKLMADKRAASATSAARLKQQPLGESARIDETGRFMGIEADSSSVLRNRTVEEVAGTPTEKPSGLSAVASEIDFAQARQPSRDTEGDQQSRPSEPQSLELSQRSDQRRKETEGRGEDSRRTKLGYTTTQAATWATRRPASHREDDRKNNERTSPDSMEAALDGAMRAQEKLLAGTAARASAAGSAAVGSMEGGALAVVPAGAGPSVGGGALYGEDDRVGEGAATRAAQLFHRGGVGDMRLANEPVPSQVVRQGKFLDCALVNQLRAELVESDVVAMVVRDFVSVDGEVVLVPAGAKLVGVAGRVQNVQQARVYIRFDRLLYPDQRTVFFPRKVPAVDALGAAGADGEVDRHFFLQFGSAVMLGVLDGLAAAVQGSSLGAADPPLRDLVMGRTSSNLASVMAGIIGRYGNVVPTITVEPGEKIKVFFAEDVELTPYALAKGVSREERRRSEFLVPRRSEEFVAKGLRR